MGEKQNCEFDEAMEAIGELQRTESLASSDELLCECHPISYRQVAQYLEDSENRKRELSEILNALRIAQGCGTCLDRASCFVLAIKEQNFDGIRA